MTTRTELRALVGAATPGPWWTVAMGEWSACILSEHTAVTDGCKDGEVRASDAALIVAAVNALPSLLDDLDAKDRQIARLEALEVDRATCCVQNEDRALRAESRIRELEARVAELEGGRNACWHCGEHHMDGPCPNEAKP